MLEARGPLVFANIGRKPNFITLCVSFFFEITVYKLRNRGRTFGFGNRCISYRTVLGLLDLTAEELDCSRTWYLKN